MATRELSTFRAMTQRTPRRMAATNSLSAQVCTIRRSIGRSPHSTVFALSWKVALHFRTATCAPQRQLHPWHRRGSNPPRCSRPRPRCHRRSRLASRALIPALARRACTGISSEALTVYATTWASRSRKAWAAPAPVAHAHGTLLRSPQPRRRCRLASARLRSRALLVFRWSPSRCSTSMATDGMERSGPGSSSRALTKP
mmetsp:Transcript_33730/g.88964  ORF Transcript_33730/g.88964 Transcript_33730/m.88964 type:complete len:200 (-) Transcript_33730:1090-1689(-)